ncbi:Uncharacterised protein [Mycobacteroides abscessus subsp. abscessus]|nr:Uncharacterised protein [Mycobacteroides abscessus subsp. abscessus]
MVSVPSSRMPSSSHNPLMPAPVPTSTTARAPSSWAYMLSRAPTEGGTGAAPSSVARSRALTRISSSTTDSST